MREASGLSDVTALQMPGGLQVLAGRTWLLNLAYTRRGAMTYLRTLPVTLPEWRQAWEVTRSQWSRQHLAGE